MNKDTKITFTLNIGNTAPFKKDEFTLGELGLVEGDDTITEEEITEQLEELWSDWSVNHINGGWEFDKNEG